MLKVKLWKVYKNQTVSIFVTGWRINHILDSCFNCISFQLFSCLTHLVHECARPLVDCANSWLCIDDACTLPLMDRRRARAQNVNRTMFVDSEGRWAAANVCLIRSICLLVSIFSRTHNACQTCSSSLTSRHHRDTPAMRSNDWPSKCASTCWAICVLDE